MTWPIVDRKIDEFRTFDTTAAIAVAMIAWVSANKFINFIFYIIKIDIYDFQSGCKLLRITWLIVDRKAGKFRIFSTVIDVAFAMVA